MPAREVADGVLVIFGGALLLTPGFLSDIFGLLFLLPPTRALIRRVFLRQAMKRITVSMAGVPMPAAGDRPRATTSRARRSTSTRAPGRAAGARGVTVAARRRGGPRRGLRQRHVLVRRPGGAALRPGAARPRARRGRSRQGSALALLFSGREPVAAIARGAVPAADGAGWDALELGGVQTAIEAPLERWTVRADAADGQGFALEFSALGPAARDAAARRHGRLRAAVPRARDASAPAAASGRSTRSASAGGRGATPTGSRSSWPARWPPGPATQPRRSPRSGPPAPRITPTRRRGPRCWEPGRLLEIDDGRLSTTYDADGHARRAGLELWPADEEEWARRGAGEVLCGSSLDLGALRLDCAFFRWHLEGRAGVGRYDIVRRAA